GGEAGFLGTQLIHGSLAYLNEINAQGGVRGRKIRLISYDDQYEPSKTVTNTQHLINTDKVFALFDYVGTPTTVKIIDLVHQAEIPLLGLFTGAEDLRTPFRPYIFNIRDSYYAEAEAAVSYFVDTLSFKKIAVMYQEDDFGLAVLSGIQLALERRNMALAATETYVRGTMDVENAMRAIKSSGAEAVMMVGTHRPLAKFIKIAQDEGFEPYFHSVSFVGLEPFVKELMDKQKINPSLLDKIIVTQVVPSPFSLNLPCVKEYRELIKKYYPLDEPNSVALEGFINAKVMVEALERAGKDLSREKFIKALEGMHNFDIGIGKQLSFDILNHQGLKGVYYILITENGSYVMMGS
ncbi:MAG: ABC transporter substrate-binding protein, partial [Candidatus Methanoperedens sp.]|nr:ABC transporter substrate-binding protein [Candidatus Methanoperedens sp.]